MKTKDGVESPLKLDRAVASSNQPNGSPDKAIDDNPKSGWTVKQREPFDRDHEAIFYLEEAVTIPEGATIVATLAHESFLQSYHLGHFRISLNSQPDIILGEEQDKLDISLSVVEADRSDDQAEIVREAHLRSDDEFRSAFRHRRATQGKLSAIDNAAVKVMIMKDMEEPRKTFILNKGLYNQRRGEVSAALPAALPDLKDGAPLNRLGLAEWLVDPQHPLTARVTVNRVWAQIFGQGLVRTAENFGVQGEMPSHPELLDWLAVTFVESGWDVKALLRLIATSSAYRQTSDTDARRTALDPDNRFLSRGSRYRMPSWMIRDQALFASNLFVPKIGGPPVKPYQPEGIWKEFSFGKKVYKRDAGESLYRRSLYTYWRRIVAPPMFFDSATRQTCSVKSKRTNTPLHALATLNDTTYVEAARAMAIHLLTMPVATDHERINTAFRLTMARKATAGESALLQKSIARLREQFAADPEAATAYVSVGESKPPPGIDAVELAAYASLCLAILNTDEALTKE